MGAVYKARQKQLDRFVALKVIPPEAAEDPSFTERFNREARALARLNHPNIVTVYDFGQTGKIYYLLMEYIDGVNLRQTLQGERLSPTEALAIVPQICDALQYAHDQGVVHRDIKPENVLLDRSGRVKIADFGLAKLIGISPDNFTLTRTQQVMGTPRYMAPEQFEKPTTVDHRADIYSLGVVIYEMLTGELPVGRFALPSERVQVDVRIDEVVLRTLEREPDRRYQRVSQVKTELATAAQGRAAAREDRAYSGGRPFAPSTSSFPTTPPKSLVDHEAPQPRQPSLLLGVGLPTLIFVCIFLLLWIDVAFTQPAYDPEVRAPLSRAEEYFMAWKRTVLWTAALVIPAVFGMLAAWRTFAPRILTVTGNERVTTPFESRWSFVVIGALGLLTLLLPWCKVNVLPGTTLALDYRAIYPGDSTAQASGSTVIHEGSWRSLTLMPAGWRLTHRGATFEAGVVFAVLFAVLLLFGIFPCEQAREEHMRWWRYGLAIGCSLIGLALALSVVHRAADRDPKLLVDNTTLRGLETFARNSLGQQPTDIRRWIPAASQAFEVTPGPGMILAFAACGVALLAGLMGLTWSPAMAAQSIPAMPKPTLARPLSVDSRRIQQHVQPPAVALMVVGILGVLPVMFGACALAAVVPVYEERGPVHTRTELLDLPREAIPKLEFWRLGSAMLLSQIIAQAAPPRSDVSYAMVSVGGLAVILVLINLPVSILIFVGGWRMRRLQSYGLAVAAAIFAILPCTIVWIVAMPLGLWALFVLVRPEVREAFES